MRFHPKCFPHLKSKAVITALLKIEVKYYKMPPRLPVNVRKLESRCTCLNYNSMQNNFNCYFVCFCNLSHLDVKEIQLIKNSDAAKFYSDQNDVNSNVSL